jgi:cyclopropane-fatty-acyl-phospholipid synthase
MSNTAPATSQAPLEADFKNIQAHYDLSDEFFALFLDPSMTYSCAKFGGPDTTLADAQRAKIDLSLGKCELRPGMKLLDVGCGWGATALRAHDHYGASVTGLTLSRNQFEHDRKLAADKPGIEFRLEGWETFEMPVDRIVSIGAFEHFGRDKYAAFFAKARSLLPVTPGEGVMLLHTITLGKPSKAFSFLRFVHFMSTKIFPGGDVPAPEKVIEFARNANFEPEHVESLRAHYAQTLDCWAANLQANREKAVAVAGEGNFKTYMKYLVDCANFFRSGEVNVHQFKLRAA